jgi:molecular chaperone HtpG
LSSTDADKLKALFTVPVTGLQVSVDVKGLSVDAPPVVATRPEFMRRMKDMAAISGPMGSFYANMPDEVTLTVNGNHPVFDGILHNGNEQLQKKQVRNLADLALLSQGLLKGADLTAFITRSVDLMGGEEKTVVAEKAG